MGALARQCITCLGVLTLIGLLAGSAFADPPRKNADEVDAAGAELIEPSRDRRSGPSAESTGDLRVCHITDGTLPQDQRFGTVRNRPGYYVFGNCRGNTRFWRTRCNDVNCFWSFGYVESGMEGCGWIEHRYLQLASPTPHNHCPGGSIPESSFMFYGNCAPGECSDGSPARLYANCPSYANVRPWIPRAAERDFLWTHAAGEEVLWRYVTADNRYVMIRHPGISLGDGNWRFLPMWCFNSAEFSYPDDYPGGRNPYHVYWWRSAPA